MLALTVLWGWCKKFQMMKKASSTQRTSQAVPHPSTDRALQRLTSKFGRDSVYSLRYGRWQTVYRIVYQLVIKSQKKVKKTPQPGWLPCKDEGRWKNSQYSVLETLKDSLGKNWGVLKTNSKRVERMFEESKQCPAEAKHRRAPSIGSTYNSVFKTRKNKS